MTREIKFRAWDKQNSCWANLNELSDWGSASFTACIGMGNAQYPYTTFRIESDETYEIQQFTGLFDKNGKEIYEGDILGVGKDNKYQLLVEWGKWPGDENDVTGYDISQIEAKQSEVIGNIYENPELIKNN